MDEFSTEVALSEEQKEELKKFVPCVFYATASAELQAEIDKELSEEDERTGPPEQI